MNMNQHHMLINFCYFIRSQMFLSLHNIYYKTILAFFFQINKNCHFQEVIGEL